VFIVLYVWLEHHLSRGDYRRKDLPAPSAKKPNRVTAALATNSARSNPHDQS
jgi:hypothetical protein